MSGGCGTYTNRANCYGVNQVFVAGATSGATCSACASLMTLTSYTPGVTYTMVFNQGTTNGTFYDGSPWVQEKDGLKLLKVKISYVGMTGSRVLNFSANTKVAGLTLTPSGYKGSVYVHGSAKNPEPVSYYDPTLGQVLTKEPFISITYEDYNSGWLGPKSIGATDNPVNYSQFDLTSFLNMQGQFKYTGVTMKAGDVFVASASNFDNEKTETSFLANASGYVYQLFTRRANTLTYGVLNCLSATGAALAGSTSCFRPPVTWKPEDRINRPIYKISDVEGKIPGQSGHTLIHVSTNPADDNLIYDVETAASCAQASEFGGGANYGTTTPVWAMGGARSNLTSYGEQFIAPLQTLLETIHATGSTRTRLTHQQRKDGLIRIVQYGLDSWGAQTVFSGLAAGAGQKAGRTRGWIPLAGYYLGVSAMYDPEATMILDTARTQKWSENVYESIKAISPEGSCITRAEWRRFRSGDTGPQNNYRGLRRQLANNNAHDALTMYEYVDNPANLVLHYDYVGKAYRGTVISGFGTGGATGITFYNEFRTQTIDSAHEKVRVSGNFGVIRWGSTLSSENPLSKGYFGYSNKAGSGGSFKGMWLRVESGPGSSGPGGATASRFYRILWSNGFRSDSEPVPAKINSQGGWQIVIGQTWADGMPDHTSVIKFYPYIQADMGLTRPSYFDPLGYTYGPVGFIRVAQPDEGCGATWSSMADATLWDANSAGETPYFQNSLDAWAPQYLLADYLMRTKGVTLVSDAFNIPDYIRQYVYTSPWNIHSLYPWYSGTSAVFHTWLGTTWTDATLAESRINFGQHYPGIVNYRGITV